MCFCMSRFIFIMGYDTKLLDSLEFLIRTSEACQPIPGGRSVVEVMLDDMGLSGVGGNRQPDHRHETLQNHQYRILLIDQARNRRPREVALSTVH